MRSTANRPNADGHVEPLLAGGEDDGVDGRHIGIFAADRECDVVAVGKDRIGWIEVIPAGLRAAPDLDSGVHGVRAFEARRGTARLGAQVAADISRRQARPRSAEIMIWAKSTGLPRRSANGVGGVGVTLVEPIRL
jgi:hypothetical protein